MITYKIILRFSVLKGNLYPLWHPEASRRSRFVLFRRVTACKNYEKISIDSYSCFFFPPHVYHLDVLKRCKLLSLLTATITPLLAATAVRPTASIAMTLTEYFSAIVRDKSV